MSNTMRALVLLVLVASALAQNPGPINNIGAEAITATGCTITWFPTENGKTPAGSYNVLQCQDAACQTVTNTWNVPASQCYYVVTTQANTAMYYMVQAVANGATVSGSIIAVQLSSAGANVNCAAASPLPSFNTVAVGGSTAATRSGILPGVCGTQTGSWGAGLSWYSWTAPASGWYTLDNCIDNGTFPSVIGVYLSSPGCVTSLPCVNQLSTQPCGNAAQVSFNAINGQGYYFVIGGAGNTFGNYNLQLNQGSVPGLVTGLQANMVMTGRFSLKWNALTIGANQVWYTVYLNGAVKVGSTQLTQWQVTAGLTGNTTYTVQVQAFTMYAYGPLSQPIYVTTLPVSNDQCWNAIPVTVSNNVVQGTLAGATAAAGFEDCSGKGFNSSKVVWYSYTNTGPNSRTIQLDTCGTWTTFNTILSVFTGDCNSTGAYLQCVTFNDDGCADGPGSAVTFQAFPGVTYQIAVYNKGALGFSNGNFGLGVSYTQAYSAPFNVVPIFIGPDTIWFEWEAPANFRNLYVDYGIFYSCAPPCSGGYVNTGNFYFGSALYPQYEIQNLTLNTTYQLSIGAFMNGVGLSQLSSVLTFSTLTLGPGQSYATPAPLGIGPSPFTIGMTQGIYIQPFTMGDTCGQVVAGRPTAWYSFGGTGGNVTLSTCNVGTFFDTEILVFSGQFGNFQCQGWSDDAQGCGTSSEVTVMTNAQTTYTVLIIGFGFDFGGFVLSFNDPGVASSTTCQTAPAFQTVPIQTVAFWTATNPTTVTGYPSPCPQQILPPANSEIMWYQITIPQTWGTSPMMFSTCSHFTNFNASIALFAGTSCATNTWTCPQVSMPLQSCPIGLGMKLVLRNPQAGQTIFIAVYGDATLPHNMDFVLAIDAVTPNAPTFNPLNNLALQSNSIALTWLPNPLAPLSTLYFLSWSTNGGPFNRPIIVGATSAWTVGQLNPYTQYTFQIFAGNMAGISATSSYSPPYMTLPGTPGVVSKFGFAGADLTSISLYWGVPLITGGAPPSALSYSVCIVGSYCTSFPGLSGIMTNLLPGSTYNMTVAVVSAGGVGDTCDGYFSTLGGPMTGAATGGPAPAPHGLSAGGKAGVAIVVILIILGVIGAGVVLYRRRASGGSAPSYASVGQQEKNMEPRAAPSSSGYGSTSNPFDDGPKRPAQSSGYGAVSNPFE